MYRSINNIFQTSVGPSKVFTSLPMKAARDFVCNAKKRGLLENGDLSNKLIRAELFGSFGEFGKKKNTDKGIILGFLGEDPEENCDFTSAYLKVENFQKKKIVKILEEKEMKFAINFNKNSDFPIFKNIYRNGVKFSIVNTQQNKEEYREIYYLNKNDDLINEKKIKSLAKKNAEDSKPRIPYPFKTMEELTQICKENNMTIPQLVFENEKALRSSNETLDILDRIIHTMRTSVNRGLTHLGVKNKPALENPMMYVNTLTSAAIKDYSQGGSAIITAGNEQSLGVLSAIISYYEKFYSKKYLNKTGEIILTSAAIWNVLDSGLNQERDYDSDDFSSVAISAAGLTYALGGNLHQVEEAAAVALRHLPIAKSNTSPLNQNLTVSVNAMKAQNAINSASLALNGLNHAISLDEVIRDKKFNLDVLSTPLRSNELNGDAKNDNQVIYIHSSIC